MLTATSPKQAEFLIKSAAVRELNDALNNLIDRVKAGSDVPGGSANIEIHIAPGLLKAFAPEPEDMAYCAGCGKLTPRWELED